jgi:hypothetical protein
MVYLSHPSNRVSLLLVIVNGGLAIVAKSDLLIHIWLMLDCESPIGRMGQLIPYGGEFGESRYDAE